MKTPAGFPRSIARPTGKAIHVLGLALALLVPPAREAFAQVESVVVSKNYGYVQTSATSVVLDPAGNNYGFSADVNGLNIGAIAAPIVTGPFNVANPTHNNGRLLYSPGDKGWRYGAPSATDFGTSTLANLDALFGSGTYTFVVNGASIPLRLTGDAYPNAPVLTLSGGVWANGKYVFDPGQPLTITTNAFAAYGSHVDDVIGIAVIGGTFVKPFSEVAPYGCKWGIPGQLTCQSHSSVPATNFVSHTFPPNTFAAGQEYFALGLFEAVVDARPDPALPGSVNVATYSTRTFITLSAVAPIFPMTVRSNITATTATASADIQYRPQDVGTTGSVYVFALAPATRVVGGLSSQAMKVGLAKGGPKAETPIACVLAQLSQTGQMIAVTSAQLQAYLTGVLSAQGASVSILNGVPTGNVSGATFFVGYGTSGTAMINSGINRSAVTVPGTPVCQPGPPQAGWWWNPLEDGRGFSLEVRGNNIFFAAFLYDVSGRSTWYVSTGPVSLDGSLYNGDLLSAKGGQTLGGAYPGFPALASVGTVTMTFNDASQGTLVWPGGTVPIQRFNIVPNGLNLPEVAGQPESGWWWNEQEAGRGFFMEWQGGNLDIAGYMYDDAGNSVWYLTTGAIAGTSAARSFGGNWWSFGGGQTLAGAWKPNRQLSNNVAPMTIQFSGPETAIMTLPGGRTTNLKRHRF